MEATPSGVIRKIIVGTNPKDDGLVFSVDQTFGNNTITNIIEDVNDFFIFGSKSYLVYVKIKDKPGSVLWKKFERVPVTIEYDLSNSVVLV